MHWIDVSIMAVYTIGIFTIGLLSRGKDKDAADYFIAGGTLNTWFHTIVVGLSIAATFFSGISFIAYPSIVYSNGILLTVWGLLVCMPIYYIVLRFWFLPRYLSGNWEYPYQVLEARFGPGTRTFAAGLYILMRIGWMAAMIYAPTVAIITMGNLDSWWFWPIVLITGLSNTIYTVVSGVRGVIVTEALHIPVIVFGISATIASAWWQLPVPFSTALSDLAQSGRLNIFDFSVDPRAPLTVWTVVFGVSIGNLTNYIGDQMSLQRYLVTGDVQAASRSFAVNVVGVVIVVVLLTVVGLSMHAYSSHTIDPKLPTRADEVFPHFVATRLPVGVAGLLLAALLAATGIPSGINTLAAVLTLDFHARIRTGMTAAQQVWWGRFYSLLIGLLATLTAGIVSKLGTLFELSQIILGLFAGPLLSCIVVAVGGWRCTGRAMVVGMLLGWMAGVAVTWSGAAAPWVAPSAAITTLIASLVLSRFDRLIAPVTRREPESPAVAAAAEPS
jgi:SSS family solute:Na+ symporter